MKNSFKSRINNIRRNIMRSFTGNIGKNKSYDGLSPVNRHDVKRILVVRPNNRLGNLLLITPLVQEIEATFPQCKVDLFVKGFLAPIIFKNYPNVESFIQLPKKPFEQLPQYLAGWARVKKRRYDIVINVVNSSSSGRLSVQFARSKYKFYGDSINDANDTEDPHIARYPVYNFRKFITLLGVTPNTGPVAPLSLKLSAQELAQGKKTLDELVPANKKTICIFTYATGTKCYPPTWWEPFYDALKNQYPDYNIIEVLPAENVSQIDFKAPSYYSKDVREIGAVMANTSLFIGADSGIMHLASAVQVPVIGLFSKNNISAYEPYGNGSIAIDTRTTIIEECVEVIKNVL
jgi:ADP-heptose:LPS heptosyltransferase